MSQEQALFQRGLQQLCNVGDAEFLHHVCAMRLRCFNADVQLLCNRTIRESRLNQLQDLIFTTGEILRATFGYRRLGSNLFDLRHDGFRIPSFSDESRQGESLREWGRSSRVCSFELSAES